MNLGNFVDECVRAGGKRVKLSLHGGKNVQLSVRTYTLCLRRHIPVISH